MKKFLGFGLLLLLVQSFAFAQTHPVYFVFNNQTGFNNDSIYITSQSAGTLDAYAGDGSAFNGNTSYSLDQLLGNLPNGTLTNVPIIYANTISGGYFSITAGQTIGSSLAPSNIISGRLETVVQTGPSSGPAASAFYNTNVDVSYVNQLSMPMSFSILNRSDNTPVTLVNQLNPVNTSSTIWNAVTSNANIPTQALVPAVTNYQIKNSSGQIGTVTGNVTALASGTSGAGYHDWLTNSGGHTSLLNTLQSANSGAGANLNVSSYTVPTGDAMGGISWTFSTVSPTAGTSPFGSNDSSNRFLQGQTYTTTANFNTNLNPGGADSNLTSLGIGNNTAGVHISGHGGDGTGAGNTVGNLDIYITNASLNNSNGIYGSNPVYVVKWTSFSSGTQTGTTYYISQQNSNNFVDRVVGDITAAITFGWAGSDDQISSHASATSTEGTLANSIFSDSYSGSGTSVATTNINGISTSQYFYLLSLLGVNGEGTPGQSGENIADWSGSQINPANPLLYDNYGDAIVADTDSYTYPYSDRLQQYSPDIFPMPATGSPSDADTQYIYVTLSPGGYTYTVPEPSAYALLSFGLVTIGAGVIARRRKLA